MMVENNETHLDAEVLTIKEVAQYLRLSEAKVYEMARNGSIPAFRIGKSWRFQRDSLMAWIRRGTGELKLKT
jgi:excisionase family DNA binding protein